jgi:hypothetical protein
MQEYRAYKTQTSLRAAAVSAYRGKADSLCSPRVIPGVTLNGHLPSYPINLRRCEVADVPLVQTCYICIA